MDCQLIELWARGGEKLRRAVAGLSEKELQARPGPGAWSIHELVVHLAGSDAIAIDRMKRILTEENPTLLYADESAYVERLFTHDQSFDDALLLFEVNRRQFARVLRRLSDEAFERPGMHNKAGVVTVGRLVAMYVQHLDNHLEFLLAKRKKLGKPLTPETRGFAFIGSELLSRIH